MQPVHENEELTTSYIPTDLPLEDRRELLLENWGFWCTCPRCSAEEAEQLQSVTKEMNSPD